MKTRHLFLFLLSAAAGLTACSSLLVSSTPPPVYYQLDYQPVKVDCPNGFQNGVRIWPFATSTPYNQPDMVVVEKGQQVNFSSQYQWVAPPGTLLPDSILRDLSGSGIFPQAVNSNSPLNTPLELTGHIFTFAWEKTDSAYHAVLKTEVSLVDTTGKHRVILRRNYAFQSGPFEKNRPENFASAMSGVARNFSINLQEDLCKAAKSQ